MTLFLPIFWFLFFDAAKLRRLHQVDPLKLLNKLFISHLFGRGSEVILAMRDREWIFAALLWVLFLWPSQSKLEIISTKIDGETIFAMKCILCLMIFDRINGCPTSKIAFRHFPFNYFDEINIILTTWRNIEFLLIFSRVEKLRNKTISFDIVYFLTT